MKKETKKAEKTNIGEDKPEFQQAEPAELDEADLQGVAGGGIVVEYVKPPDPDGIPLI